MESGKWREGDGGGKKVIQEGNWIRRWRGEMETGRGRGREGRSRNGIGVGDGDGDMGRWR